MCTTALVSLKIHLHITPISPPTGPCRRQPATASGASKSCTVAFLGTSGPEKLHLAEVALRKVQPNAGFAGVVVAKPRKYAVEMALAFRSRSKFASKLKLAFWLVFGADLGTPNGAKMDAKSFPTRSWSKVGVGSWFRSVFFIDC